MRLLIIRALVRPPTVPGREAVVRLAARASGKFAGISSFRTPIVRNRF
jgi:hypothetical protein